MTESVVDMCKVFRLIRCRMHMFTLRSGIWWEIDLLKVSRVITEGGKGIFGKEIQQDTENAKLGMFNLILAFS